MPRRIMRLSGVLFACGLLQACVSASNRPEVSTLGCVRAVVSRQVPGGLGDKQTHCLAAGLIARHCSRTEANLAAAGKEVRDLFGAGDAEWADWRADRAGIQCARHAASDAAISECCERASTAAGSLRD